MWDVDNASSQGGDLRRHLKTHLENKFSKISFSSWSLDILFSFLFLFSKVDHLFSNFSFSSQSWRAAFQISPSLLENGEFIFTFSFSFWSLRKEYSFLFLFSKVENLFSNFSFSSQNWGKDFQISLSPLEIGENNFKFLFLFSIGLFGLSSHTVSNCRQQTYQGIWSPEDLPKHINLGLARGSRNRQVPSLCLVGLENLTDVYYTDP